MTAGWIGVVFGIAALWFNEDFQVAYLTNNYSVLAFRAWGAAGGGAMLFIVAAVIRNLFAPILFRVAAAIRNLFVR